MKDKTDKRNYNEVVNDQHVPLPVNLNLLTKAKSDAAAIIGIDRTHLGNKPISGPMRFGTELPHHHKLSLVRKSEAPILRGYLYKINWYGNY